MIYNIIANIYIYIWFIYNNHIISYIFYFLIYIYMYSYIYLYSVFLMLYSSIYIYSINPQKSSCLHRPCWSSRVARPGRLQGQGMKAARFGDEVFAKWKIIDYIWSMPIGFVRYKPISTIHNSGYPQFQEIPYLVGGLEHVFFLYWE